MSPRKDPAVRVRLARRAGLALTVLTLLLAAVLCWTALDLYLDGTALRETDPTAAIFNAAAVRARLPWVLPVFGLWLAALVLAAASRRGRADAARRSVRSAAAPAAVSAGSAKPRIALLVLALVLIVLGIWNGGARDVLIKAAKICTECIGLG